MSHQPNSVQISSFRKLPLRSRLGVAVLFAAVLATCWVASGRKAKRVIAERLDFGEVWETDSLPWTLVIANEGDEPVDVMGLSTSCTCVSTTPGAFALAPGARRDVSLVLDLTGASSVRAGEGKRRFAVQIVPLLKGGTPGPPWVVRGTVKKALSGIRPSLYLGDLVKRGQSRCSKEFAVKVEVTSATRLEPICDPTLAQVAATRLAGHGGYSLAIRPLTPVGEFSIPVRLRVLASDGHVLAVSKIRARGSIVPEIQFLPRALVLGTRKHGGPLRERVTLTSVLGRPFTVQKIDADPGLAVKRTTTRGRSSEVLQLTGDTSGERDQERTVYVHCRDADNETVTTRLVIRT